MLHLGDITKINGADVPAVNAIIGGSPCQDLSVAGKRAGLSGERSGLFMEQLRIIKEMRRKDIENGAVIPRPRYMVWENVTGAFSSNKGRDFKTVLEETIGVVTEVKPDIPIPKEGWHYSGCIMGERFSLAWRVFDAQFWGVPQRRRRIALVADFGGDTAPEILFERKGVSRHTPPSRTPWEDFAAALAERFGGTNTARENVTAAGFNQDIDCENSEALGVNYQKAIGALCADDYKGINNQYVSQDKVIIDTSVSISGFNVAAFSFDSLSSNSMKSNNPNSGCRQVDVAKTIDTTTPDPSKNQGGNAIVNNSTVRRLTPLECERLQGFPDGWTDIGDYIDSNGKKRKTSDSARYKALGNSIALPSWVWVLERLSYCCGADRTMASLFDGIGGFPLIWETLNGKSTCLWASEIEEFPIAVTKRHFS